MQVEQWWQDLRLAGRGLARARGFTLAAALTLAAGIAGTTTMFALIEGVLLRPLPVREQDRLIVAWQEVRTSGFQHWPFRPSDIDAIGRSSRLLEQVAGVDYNGVAPVVATEDGSAAGAAGVVQLLGVTGGFFEVLGVEPVLGRALTFGDDVAGGKRDDVAGAARDVVAGAEDVIVISHGLWQRRYGGARDVIGRMLRLGERPFRIAGVMPAGFDYPRGAEGWISIAAARAITDPRFAASISVDLIARRKPQVTIEQASSELQALAAQINTDAPAGVPRGLTPVVRSFTDVVVGDVRMPLLALFGAVALLLLIASANVANLLLMRGESRRSELAVRAALGASHGRLARHLLCESLLLTLGGAAVGLTLTSWSLRPLIALVPGGLPRLDAVHVDAGLVVFTIALALFTAALAGLAPMLSLMRPDLTLQLRSSGRGVTASATRNGRRALVVAQVALAVTVVAVAGLLTRSLLRLQGIDLGFAADRLVFVQLAFPQTKYADQTRHFQFLDDVTARLAERPGIAAATAINTMPFAGTGGWDAPHLTAEGQSAPRAAANPSLNLEGIEPSYFATFAIPLVRGRAFTDRDRRGAPNVAIVSEDVASRVWPGEDPIGRRVKMGSPASKDPWRTIVGVARSTRYRELAARRPTIYVPARQFDTPGYALVVRTTAPLETVAAMARTTVRVVDSDVQLMRVAPFAELLAQPLARPRFNAFLIGLFGVVALLLAAVGLYAVMAAYVRLRDAEMGLRVALGATSSDVRRLVLGEGVRLAGVGAAIGLAASMAASRLLRGLLFEVQPFDPAALLIALLLLVLVSALACYLPVRRAMRLDPVRMLRASCAAEGGL